MLASLGEPFLRAVDVYDSDLTNHEWTLVARSFLQRSAAAAKTHGEHP